MAFRAFRDRQSILKDFDAFLLKPIGKQELLQTLSRFMSIPVATDSTGPGSLDSIDPELADLVPDLLHEIKEGLDAVSTGLDTEDYDTAIRLSHGFKGAAGNYRLTRLSGLFHTLHERCLANNHHEAKSQVAVIREVVDGLLFRVGQSEA